MCLSIVMILLAVVLFVVVDNIAQSLAVDISSFASKIEKTTETNKALLDLVTLSNKLSQKTYSK